jgi:hypothetical protein
MGVKLLRTFLTRNCSPTSIKLAPVAGLAGRTLVVDASIYLYKYKSAGDVVGGMERFVRTLRAHRITPIFVFDPPPSPEKMAMVRARAESRAVIVTELDTVREALAAARLVPDNEDEILRLTARLDELRPSVARVSAGDRRDVRALFDKMRVYYVTPAREADMYCAYLVLKGHAWGVISNDSDMFVYGCAYVVMDLDVDTQTCIIHDTRAMMADLRMTHATFKDVAVVSGTDYSMDADTTLPESLHHFYKYKNEFVAGRTRAHFYDWLAANTDYIKDPAVLKRVHAMFDPVGNADAALFASLAERLPPKRGGSTAPAKT